MIWVRRILAAPLLLLGFICGIGMIRIFARNLPDATVGDGVFAAFVAAVSAAAAYFLLKPDLERARSLSGPRIRGWAFTSPLGQAALCYAPAAVIMAAAPKAALAPGFAAQCLFSVWTSVTAVSARRWWGHAALAVLCFVLLMGALAGTAEALTPRGFGEGGMIFLLPMEGFPILLAISALVRAMRAKPSSTPMRPTAD